MPTRRQLTPAQQAASRRNGALSAGRPRKPRTPLADSVVANRTTAKTVCLPAEDQEAFQTLLQSFLDHFQPSNDIEFLRVETLASIEWRLRRLWDSERSILATQMHTTHNHTTQPSEPTAGLDAPSALLGRAQRDLSDSSRALDKVQIQEGRLVRAYDRTLAQLLALRKNRARIPGKSLIPRTSNLQKPPKPGLSAEKPETEVLS